MPYSLPEAPPLTLSVTTLSLDLGGQGLGLGAGLGLVVGLGLALGAGDVHRAGVRHGGQAAGEQEMRA